MTWWRHTLAVLLAIGFGLANVSVANAQDGGESWLREVPPSWTDRAVVMLEYRADNPQVSHKRNVATFPYIGEGGVPVWIVAPSLKKVSEDVVRIGIKVGDRPLSTRIIPVSAFEAETGINPVNKHAEFLVWAFMDDEQRLTVTIGETEFQPCTDDPHLCRIRLKPDSGALPDAGGPLFPNANDITYQFKYGNGDEAEDAQSRRDHKIHLDRWVAGANRQLPPAMEGSFVTAPNGLLVPASTGFFSLGGGAPPQGGAVGALAGAAGDDLGGVDLTTLELRYLADPGDGQGLQYAFHAEESDGEEPDLDAGRVAASHASDAFFVWLSLPKSTFWVNLDPLEPDRIIHPALATTDAGRILLEADLEMKKTVADLIHPDTELGQRYWAVVPTGPQLCSTARMWIVPGPASVYEEDGGLYILDAPLEVRTEPIGVGSQHRELDPCVRASSDPEPPDERFFRTEVLPLVEEAVNEAPEYAELRQVYLSRVAAEWYRQRSRHHDTRLASLIDSGDVSAWPAGQEWSPTDVFDAYVESFEEGEFDLVREHQDGSFIIENHYFYGGVELDRVELAYLDGSHFQDNWAHLPNAIDQSLESLALDPAGGIWLGATSYPTVSEDWEEAAASPLPLRKVTTWIIAIVLALIVGGVATAIVLVLTHGRRARPQPPYPFR